MTCLRKAWPLAMTAALAACDRRLDVQPKYHPLDESAFFSDGRSARPLVAGTVPVGGADPELAAGRKGGSYLSTYPYPVDRAFVLRGKERFEVYCAVCHDRTGSGNGMVIRRGLRPPPPDYASPRLLNAPAGLFVSVIANGYGRMYPYNDKVSARDRWAIAAYIKVLQIAAHSSVRELPKEDQAALEALK